MNRFTLYYTANNNYRVLVNGKVHPLMCGLSTVDAALDKLGKLFPQGKIDNLQDFVDPR